MWRKTQNKSLVFPLSPQTMLIKGQQTVLKEDLFFPLTIKNKVKMKQKKEYTRTSSVLYQPHNHPQKLQRKKKESKKTMQKVRCFACMRKKSKIFTQNPTPKKTQKIQNPSDPMKNHDLNTQNKTVFPL